MKNKTYGFTLAEVLITLVIIGVIAAMTIPTLINKTNNHEYVSRLKKTYSTLSQATNRIIAEEGKPRADIGGWATTAENVFNLYKKYLSNTKECLLTTGCFAGTYRHMDNTSIVLTNSTARYNLILADGSVMSVYNNPVSSDCSNSGSGTNNACLSVLVDVNGAKGPNVVGRDTFSFALKEDGLFPTGCDYNNCAPSSGWGCTCKVIRENAMNY